MADGIHAGLYRQVNAREIADLAWSALLGPRATRLGQVALGQMDIRARARPILREEVRVTVAGRTVSENLVLFAPPKEIKLTDPALKYTVSKSRNGMEVSLTVSRPALWTWLKLEGVDARYSDNFVHLTPDAPARIVVEPARPLSKAEFIKSLRIRSLFNTYTDL